MSETSQNYAMTPWELCARGLLQGQSFVLHQLGTAATPSSFHLRNFMNTEEMIPWKAMRACRLAVARAAAASAPLGVPVSAALWRSLNSFS